MHKEVKARYEEHQVLKKAAQLYDFQPDQITLLGDAENYVYEYQAQNGESYILKITHTIRRSRTYILGEMDWIQYLSQQGVAVAKPVLSTDGNIVEAVQDQKGGAFLLRVYEKAPGRKVNESDWNGTLFQTLGEYTGRMHRLTKQYHVKDALYKRQEWYEEEQLKLERYIPAQQTVVLQRKNELMQKLLTLPTSKDDYGLVHADLHHGNFHYHQGEIIAFDFDDIGYHWFVNDISILLYNVLWYPVIPYENKAEFTAEFMSHFLKGYRKENELDDAWLTVIPDFLMLRHLLIYGLLHQAFDLQTMDSNEKAMLSQFRKDIEQNTPITPFDFGQLAR
ncbi:phosphotransferase enzyme family protein [Bacillus sp. 179-C3.3 HS]|uniref:phosphotransferase enzyme family protein n=1 Tax=Bacillus sp. 179-C3.3 HS TaxID=3232162 RepID=UPI0039A0341B